MKPQQGVCLSTAQPHRHRVCSFGAFTDPTEGGVFFFFSMCLFLSFRAENNIQTREKQQLNVTVDDNCRRGAASFGHDVFSHAGVVSRVGEAGLLDDQVVVDGDVEVPVICRINNLLVL